MPKFHVTLEETVRYTITVEAKNATDAAGEAEELFLQSLDPFIDFAAHVENRTTFDVLPAPDDAKVDIADSSR